MRILNNSFYAKELESLPRNYTLETAIERFHLAIFNLEYGTINLNRFYIFYNNVLAGKEDSMIIAIFGVDGPPTLSLLEYDGNIIKYTTRGRIKDYVYYGYLIEKKIFKNEKAKTENTGYFLKTTESNYKDIFSFVSARI